MAIFKQNATDKYLQDATFTYESTLDKTVKLPSTHTHQGDLSWTTDSQITCKAPEILEKYTNVVKIDGLDFYLYGSKSSRSPLNLALYGYSMNVSAAYLNFSSSTFNRGRHFLLPSNTRVHFGLAQVQIVKMKSDKRSVGMTKGALSKKIQALYVTKVKGQRTQT